MKPVKIARKQTDIVLNIDFRSYDYANALCWISVTDINLLIQNISSSLCRLFLLNRVLLISDVGVEGKLPGAALSSVKNATLKFRHSFRLQYRFLMNKNFPRAGPFYKNLRNTQYELLLPCW